MACSVVISWRRALLAGLCSTALAGCSPASAPQVIAADGVLCDLTRRLAAEALPVSCLLRPQDDPHQFQLTPSQSRAVRQARLVLINGYSLTPALGHLRGTVAVAEEAVPRSPELPDPHGHGSHRDPHVWHDPRQSAAMLAVVSRRLQHLKPAAAAAIAGRERALQTQLSALHRWNQRQFATLPQRQGSRTLATPHQAFSSLSRAYGLQELPVVDAFSSNESLRPQDLAMAVQQLRAHQVPAMFSEQIPASRAMRRISELSGVPLAPQALRADGLSSNGDLMSTLTSNTCLIVEQLGGRCDRATQRRLIAAWQAIR